MPSNIRNQTIYIASGDPDTVNVSSLYKGAELGGSLSRNKREYQLVQCDTGATSATGVGVVAATQLAFWKDRAAYLVTNDLDQAQGSGALTGGVINPPNRNQVAGIFRAAITAGRYCFILKKGKAISVLADSSTYAAGDKAIANSGNNAAITEVTVGTAANYTLVGEVTDVRAGGVVPVDVNIPEVE